MALNWNFLSDYGALFGFIVESKEVNGPYGQ